MSGETPPWTRIAGPLDGVNAEFHGAYEAGRGIAVDAAPVLILLGDLLVLRRGDERRAVAVTPRVYHAIKSVCHAPVALFAALWPVGDGSLDAAVADALQRLRDHVRATTVGDDITDARAADAARSVLAATLALLDRALADARLARAELVAFARGCGPALLRLTDHATAIQLHALHAAFEPIFAAMSPAEREALQVVVAGAHQARERSLAMQYFRKRLREADGAEDRVAYAENATDEDAALALVGTRRLDRAIAGAFFDDEKRLQRDVLGDAAAALLSAWTGPSAPGRAT